jgi:hypothetical protein
MRGCAELCVLAQFNWNARFEGLRGKFSLNARDGHAKK